MFVGPKEESFTIRTQLLPGWMNFTRK